jgi:MFS family permease
VTSAPEVSPNPISEPPQITAAGRYIVLAAAFLGWMGAGMEMSPIPARPAAVYFLATDAGFGNDPTSTAAKAAVDETDVGFWAAWYNGAFLLGAAIGGLIFGSLGDRFGRAKAMGLSILCYSFFAGVAFTSRGPEELTVWRFLTGFGVGGMWPTGVALASEAWAGRNRGLVSGIIGTAANVGLSLMSLVCGAKVSFEDKVLQVGHIVSPQDWRWVMLVGASPFLVGIFVLLFVPESPAWLRKRHVVESAPSIRLGAVFRRPHLKSTLIGIVLGTVPLFGGWGCINWVVTWSDKLGPPGLNANAQFMRSFGAVFGSLAGGWLAAQFGRRTTYFITCLLSFLISGYIFWALKPTDEMFLWWIFAIGVIATTAFGWLPLCLPNSFRRVRAAGSGVSFNFGRILTAVGVLGSGFLMGALQGDYAPSAASRTDLSSSA